MDKNSLKKIDDDTYETPDGRFVIYEYDTCLVLDRVTKGYHFYEDLRACLYFIDNRLEVPIPISDFIQSQLKEVKEFLIAILEDRQVSIDCLDNNFGIALADLAILSIENGRPEWYIKCLEEKSRLLLAEDGHVVKKKKKQEPDKELVKGNGDVFELLL